MLSLAAFSRRKTLSPWKYRCLAAEPRQTIGSGIVFRCARRSVTQVPAMLGQPCVYEVKVLGPSVPEGDICVCVDKGCDWKQDGIRRGSVLQFFLANWQSEQAQEGPCPMIPRHQCFSLKKEKLRRRGNVLISYFPHTMQDVTSEEQEAACIMTPFQDESQSKSLPQFYQAILVGLISALIFRHP